MQTRDQIFGGEHGHLGSGGDGSGADVGQADHIGKLEQRLIGRDLLGLKNVEVGSGNGPCRQSGMDGDLIDDRVTRSIGCYIGGKATSSMANATACSSDQLCPSDQAAANSSPRTRRRV